MRARVILFDDAEFAEVGPSPTVIQSLDVPIVGRPDPGPGPAAGDIRVPGSTVRLRLAFLKNDRPEPIDEAETRVYASAEGDVTAEVIVSTDGQIMRNADLQALVAQQSLADVTRLYAIAATELYERRMRQVGTDMTDEQMVRYLLDAIRGFQSALQANA